MTDKRWKATKFKCKREESITYKTVNICGTHSSPEEAFEFCWISFTDEHNSLPKSTRWNVKLNKLHLEPHDYRIYYVNIDLRHQYGISVTESKTFLRAKRPQRRGAMRNGCFRRLAIVQTLLPHPLPPANVSFPLPAIFHFVSSGTHIKWNLFTPSIFFFKFPALLLVSVCVKLGYAHAWDSIRRWPHNACDFLIVFLNWKLHRLSRQNTTAHAQVWASPYLISVHKSHHSDWTFD